MNDQSDLVNVVRPHFSRREFLKSAAVLPVLPLLPELLQSSHESATAPHKKVCPTPVRRVVIYADSAHFDDRGILGTYEPPATCASATARYTNDLDETEFFKRHWFT